MENTQKLSAVIFVGCLVVLTVATASKPKPHQSTCDRALEDQNLPNPSDCSKYYRCVYGKKVAKECPEKMLFNPKIGNCDLYYNVDCPHKQNEVQNDHNTEEAIENLTGRSFAKNGRVRVGRVLAKFNEESGQNDSYANERSGETSTLKFVYLPHEEDLRAYYKIENGERHLLYCDKGMIFSFDMEICATIREF